MAPVESLENICRHIEKARETSPVAAESVRCVAASKSQPAEAIRPFLEAGHQDFGENRVQEAAAKWPVLRELYPSTCLHLIGALQSNKAKEALSLFDAIHTIDRASLVDAIVQARRLTPDLRCQTFFMQINTGAEPKKSGVLPGDAEALLRYCKEKSLPIQGLMCVPPASVPPAPHFAFLAQFARMQGISCLSMGMSGDFEIAVRLGATHVRIGTALFGARVG